MKKEKLYKDKYLIAIYEYDLSTDSEGLCIAVAENVMEILEHFSIDRTEDNIRSMKNKIYYSIRKAKRNSEQMIRIMGETYLISLIPSKRKHKRKRECIVEGDQIYGVRKQKN